MVVRPAQRDDVEELWRMWHALLPHTTRDEFDRGAESYWRTGNVFGAPSAIFVLDRGDGDGRLGGFVEFALRSRADGCLTSPVGYIEAWYVDEDVRKQGWGRALVEAGERWAQQQGCSEAASDCLISNEVSPRAHAAMGYEEVDRCINFRKSIARASSPAVREEDWIELTDLPLAASRAVEFVTDARAGGIDVFLGTTRAEANAQSQPLAALDYEAYPEMAVEQMRDLAARARQHWAIVRLALLHRTGRVALGEPSVLIAVACAHRGEAFDACRWLIDTLKAEVAIWKKEVWVDGTITWVAGNERMEGGR